MFKPLNNYKYTSNVRIDQPWAYKKCNWEEFQAKMNRNWTSPIIWTVQIVEDEVDKLMKDIKDSLLYL